ncbi:cysteine desulfurase family protein [Mycetocola reblochoni]|uniref:cysteine desulfurase family protein n=1 Tax=Mycetocola reblochoni TaxID=331618 RepID=UPI003F94A002
MSVYIDHAATTPLRPEARDAALAEWELTGNPASIHAAGQAARTRLESARERLAAVLGCDPIEVVLTSGGTESINAALKGFFWQRNAVSAAPVVVVPEGEHHATLDTVDWLAQRAGARPVLVPLARDGAVPVDAVARALGAEPGRVAWVSVIWVNNEVGTVSDIDAIARLCAQRGVPLHVDAVAAGGLALDFAERRRRTGSRDGAGLVAVSVSAHKVGGPVGVGALVLSRDVAPEALLHGGGQQRRLRSGTQDVAAAAAFAAAAEAAARDAASESARLRSLRDRLIAGARRLVPGVRVNGAVGEGHDATASDAIAHLSFPGCEADSLLFLLDMAGVQVSTGSACQAGVPEPSHVLRAMGRSESETRGALRLSLGWTSSEADVDAFLAALPEAHARAVAAGLSDRVVAGRGPAPGRVTDDAGAEGT